VLGRVLQPVSCHTVDTKIDMEKEEHADHCVNCHDGVVSGMIR
jgi:hypothetical protein